MSTASNIMTSVILSPLITLLAGLSLSVLQRSFEWVSSIAKTPQKGTLRLIKPYVKRVDEFLDRLLGGNKFTVNATNMLLMAIVVLLLANLLSTSEARDKQIKKKPVVKAE
jgi:hypothetical protein